MQKDNILQALKIDEKDFSKIVNVLQTNEVGMDLNKKGKLIKELNVKKKDHCFALFISKMIMDAAANSVTEFYTTASKLSQDTVSDLQAFRGALQYLNAFLQGTDSESNNVRLLSVFIPVTVLVASPITPLSVAVELFVKLIRLHKFSYGDILKGLNIYLEIINPVADIPMSKIN